MPLYEYFCHACKRSFSRTLTPAEYAEGTIICPHCHSEDVEQRIPALYPITSRGSA
jgi:putative FmdB family regulatory protein